MSEIEQVIESAETGMTRAALRSASVALAKRNEDVSEKMAYARRLIAMRFYEPRSNGMTAGEAELTGWHGYSETVKATAKHYGVEPEDAHGWRAIELVVQEAALSLADPTEGKNPEVRRQAMRLRLQHLLQICHGLMDSPQVETTWKWVEEERDDPERMGRKKKVWRKVKAKEKITKGTNAAIIAQATALEVALANLDQLTAVKEGQGTAELLAMIMNVQKDEAGGTTGSFAAAMLGRGMKGMDPESLQRLAEGAREVSRAGRRPRNVESKVVEAAGAAEVVEEGGET
jgi:hypothetical protein